VLSRCRKDEDDVVNAVHDRQTHSMVYYLKKRSPRPLNDRDFVTRFVWRARGAGFVLVTAPTSIVARPLLKDVVRAEYLSAMKIAKISDGETRLEYVCRPDAGGNVPAFIVNRYVARFVSLPTRAQEHFQKLRPLSDLDEKDGRAVGEALLIKVDAESKNVRPSHLSWEAARMRALFAQYRGLKEAGERYEWLEGMLAKVVRNKLR
jgi:hypothetical protein